MMQQVLLPDHLNTDLDDDNGYCEQQKHYEVMSDNDSGEEQDAPIKRKPDIKMEKFFIKLKKFFTSKYRNADREFKMFLTEEFKKLANACCVCGFKIVDNGKLRIASYFIDESKKDITTTNLKIVCNVCHNMVNKKNEKSYYDDSKTETETNRNDNMRNYETLFMKANNISV